MIDVSEPIVIRQAIVDDASLLSEIGTRTFYDTFAEQNTAENMNQYIQATFYPDKQQAEIADPRAIHWIAYQGSVPVGYAKLYDGVPDPCVKHTNVLELSRLYVDKNCIGKGVGAKLMQECKLTASTMGKEVLWLGVWEHNHRARTFYEKWGFRIVGDHIFPLGDDPQTDLIMELAL